MKMLQWVEQEEVERKKEIQEIRGGDGKGK